MKWKFEPPGTTKSNPSHLSYFDDEALDDPASALVREDIQNRLDAKSSDEDRIIVRYYLPKEPATAEIANKWFGGLEHHLNSNDASEVIEGYKFNSSEPMPYCAIECFQTRGLVGNTEQRVDPKPEDGNQDFFWFLRNVGRSKKKKGDRGRWGLGKVVYPASSKIRSFCSYSVEENKGINTLIGRSVLCIHEIEGNEFQSEGYGGEYKADDSYWASPLTDSEELEQFKKDFSLTRRSDDTGLSLVIPFPKDDITYETVFNALVKQFFWEFLRGTLECVIEDDSGRSILLEKEGLMDSIHGWPGFKQEEKDLLRDRLTFCKQADDLSLKSDNYFDLSEPKSYGNPKIEGIFASEEKLELAKQKFSQGELLAFECPIKIENLKNGNTEIDSLLVYIQRTDDVNVCDEMFIRDGLTIVGESAMKLKGVRSLVLAEHQSIAEFLGDSENPAHTKWLKSTKHFKGKYNKGDAILTYIKKSASKLANYLGQVDNTDQFSLLEDIFGIDLPEEDEGKKKPTKRPGPKKPLAKPDPKPIPKYITTNRLKKERGFTVGTAPDATGTPKQLKILAAFDTESGNPLNKYHPADFDFSATELDIKLEGCTFYDREYNILVVDIVDPDFQVSVAGFTGNRDIYLKAIPIT